MALQSEQYFFKRFGIYEPVNIFGSLDLLHEEPDSPVVFLIDEMHHNIDSINYNVQNAFHLIEKANVNIIGVESHSGGKQWDEYYKEYRDDEDFDETENNIIVNAYPHFANKLIERYPGLVYGVECKGMFNKMECDLSKYDSPDLDRLIPEHPLNIERSKHFIRTIFELRLEFNKTGNLILNCGSSHNNDIVNLITSNEIENLTKCKATYIRLNSIED